MYFGDILSIFWEVVGIRFFERLSDVVGISLGFVRELCILCCVFIDVVMLYASIISYHVE